jgi:hypothetical protein
MSGLPLDWQKKTGSNFVLAFLNDIYRDCCMKWSKLTGVDGPGYIRPPCLLLSIETVMIDTVYYNLLAIIACILPPAAPCASMHYSSLYDSFNDYTLRNNSDNGERNVRQLDQTITRARHVDQRQLDQTTTRPKDSSTKRQLDQNQQDQKGAEGR